MSLSPFHYLVVDQLPVMFVIVLSTENIYIYFHFEHIYPLVVNQMTLSALFDMVTIQLFSVEALDTR